MTCSTPGVLLRGEQGCGLLAHAEHGDGVRGARYPRQQHMPRQVATTAPAPLVSPTVSTMFVPWGAPRVVFVGGVPHVGATLQTVDHYSTLPRIEEILPQKNRAYHL